MIVWLRRGCFAQNYVLNLCPFWSADPCPFALLACFVIGTPRHSHSRAVLVQRLRAIRTLGLFWSREPPCPETHHPRIRTLGPFWSSGPSRPDVLHPRIRTLGLFWPSSPCPFALCGRFGPARSRVSAPPAPQATKSPASHPPPPASPRKKPRGWKATGLKSSARQRVASSATPSFTRRI